MTGHTRGGRWFAAGVIVTVVMALFYVAVHHAWRMGADEPQRSMASDTAYVLEHGGQPGLWADGKANVNMAYSMAPFIILYDAGGNAVGGNGYLNGEIPNVPQGVLADAKAKGENSVTWEPAPGVHIASVTIPAGDNYVLGGRSLLMVDQHIAAVGQWMFILWAVTMVGLFVACKATEHKRPKHTTQ